MEWTELTPEDYMKLEYVENACVEQERLKDLMLSVFDREVSLLEIGETEEENTIPYPEFINIIENNISILTANGYIPLNMEPVRKWLGEFNDIKPFSYRDVNRWFASFKKIEEMIMGSSKRLLVTGMFSSGDSRERQLLAINTD